MTMDYSGDLRSHVSHELDDHQREHEQTDRELRRLRAQLAEVLSGNLVRASAIQGVIPPTNGGSGTTGNTLGAVSIWLNNSGGAQVQGTVVVEDGDRLFDASGSVDQLTVIGVLDDASIANGSNGHVRHLGYQSVVKVQGAVVAGHYLRASATAGRAEDAGATPTTGSFAMALTAFAGPGAGTVAAFVFPPALGASGTIDASAVTYTPADASDWSGGVDPGNQNNANDQLADRMKVVEGTIGGSGTTDDAFVIALAVAL